MSSLKSLLKTIDNEEIKNSKEKRKLLIIDDNKEVTKSIKHILNKDYEIFTCNTYLDIEKINLSEIPVVLLDIKIAYKDGIDIFTELKEKSPNVKVIFHSAYPGSDSAVKKATALPYDEYLTKGEYTISTLFEILEKVYTK